MGLSIIAMTATTALADQAWWTGLAGTSWNAGLANWNTTATSGTQVSVLPGLGTDVFFSTSLPYATLNLDTTMASNFTINSLNFTAKGGAASVNTFAGTLTLNASGGIGLTVEGGARRHNFAGAVLLAAPQTWINNGPTGVISLGATATINSTAAGGQLTIDGSGTTDLRGTIGSNITGGLIKTGSGLLTLTGNSNAYSGGLTINGGTVEILGDSQLGATGSGVVLNSGGTLYTWNTMTLGASRTIAINGSASNPSGLMISSTLTTGVGQLMGSGTLRVSNDNPGLSGVMNIDGANAGFTGKIVIGAEGQLIGGYYSPRDASGLSRRAEVYLRNNGSLANATGITVAHSGYLSIQQSSSAVTNRLGTAPLAFHTGQFKYDPSANGGAAISDSFGAVTVSGEWSIYGSSVAGPAAGTTLNFGNLTRLDHATLSFQTSPVGTQGAIGGAPASTSVRMLFANMTPDTLTSGITRSVIPWAGNVNSSSFEADNLMTYDANGFRPLDIATETTSSLVTGANVRPTTEFVPTGGISINSLSVPFTGNYLMGNATASAAGNVLTIASGAVTNASSSFRFIDAAVNFPSGGYIFVGNYTGVTGNSRFMGSGGITVASQSELQFSNTPNGGNTFTGGLYINGDASVTFTLNNQLGNNGSAQASESIYLGGGGLLYNPSSASTASLSAGGGNRAIVVNESGGIIGTARAGAVLQVPGAISGPGRVQFGGGRRFDNTGVVELTNASANTYTGGTVVARGVLRISNVNQLGTGSVYLNGGTLQASGNLTFTEAPKLVNHSVIDTQANNVTLSSGFTSSAGTNGVSATTMSLSKLGSGTLTIAGNSDFAGVLNSYAGRVVVSGSISGLSGMEVGSTASVELGASYRFGTATALTLSGGTFATGGFSEDLGKLTLSTGVLSVIDMGNGASRLALADSRSQSWSGTLNIRNWNGSPTGGGTDQIYFGFSSSALTTSQIAQITFVNPVGYAPGNYTAQLLSTGELIAVPEPGSAALLLGGGLVLGVWRRRKRR